MDSFFSNLFKAISDNIRNNYTDNFDFERFGDEPKEKNSIKSFLLHELKKRFRIVDYDEIKMIEILDPYFDRMEQVYSILQDGYSKDLYIKLIAYKILGYRKVKLPLNTSEYWAKNRLSDELRTSESPIEAPFVGGRTVKLYKFDLSKKNIPLKLYTSDIYPILFIDQYENDEVKIDDGDILLDCGGCWGDTAMFFAHKVGNFGHVYSFEFIPENINIFKQNISLNESISNRITLVEKALGEKTDETLCFSNNGPGSRLGEPSTQTIKVQSITIDDFVRRNNVSKVDFIKMDIEGSELPSLKGAINVLKEFKPKLAISIYHSLDDFVNIPIFLESLHLEYRFYIKHGTIHNEETVLLATCK